jgi:PAS domain S-box-containing protein
MSGSGTVLLVDDDPGTVGDRLTARGFDVEVVETLDGALTTLNGGYGCVVCGGLEGHTVAEIVTRFGRASVPVVFVYDDEEAATTALDAGAVATIPRRDADGEWGSHLAATVDSVRRRESETGDGEALLSEALDELQDIIFLVSVDGTFLRWNEKLAERTGYDDAEIEGMSPTDFFEGEDVSRIENAIGRVVMNGRATEVADIVTKDGRSIPHQFTGALVEAGDTQAIVGSARDVRERQERERELTAQAERLEAVNHVNAVIRDVTGALVGARTRSEIVETVPRHLTAENTYRFAWIGSYDADSGRVEPAAWAGEGEGYLQERPGDDELDDGAVTALTAVREGEVVFAQDIAEAPEAEGWGEVALAYGHRAAAAIPVVYDGATYGCLCLYADRPDAFGPLEREVLAELGEIIGHAVHAAETRRALTADTVTELQFRLVDEASFLVQAAKYADAELELVGSVSQPSGAIVQLFAVTGIDPEDVRGFAEAAPMPAAVVTERENECVAEVTVESPSIAHVLAEFGGTVTSISVADEVRIRAEVPPGADLNAVLEAVRDVYDVQLLSQREVEREDRPDVDFRSDVERHLTERQLEVLETAFQAGFFDWPREQTGKEVAELLDVSPPTFHQHLRVGERKLLEVLFESDPDDGAAATAVEGDLDGIDPDPEPGTGERTGEE